MKFLGLLLLLLTLYLATAYIEEDDEQTRCMKCFEEGENNVCSKERGTFYNLCQLKCSKAEYLHDGKCESEDLLNNVKYEK